MWNTLEDPSIFQRHLVVVSNGKHETDVTESDSITQTIKGIQDYELNYQDFKSNCTKWGIQDPLHLSYLWVQI